MTIIKTECGLTFSQIRDKLKTINSLLKYLIMFFIAACYIPCNAQLGLNLTFNSTHSGRNIVLATSRNFKNKNEFGLGLRYNINKLAHNDDQMNVYLKRLYATKPIHYFGIEGFYHRTIFTNLDCIKPFIFYDVQATYSTTRNRMFIPIGYDLNGDVLYKEAIEYFGPFYWIEQCVGVGFKAKIYKSFYLTQKIGFGTSFILGKEKKLLSKYFKGFTWEFAGLLNAGIGYKF